jgi:hypothetical protein
VSCEENGIEMIFAGKNPLQTFVRRFENVPVVGMMIWGIVLSWIHDIVVMMMSTWIRRDYR